MKLTPKGLATRARIVEGAATFLRGSLDGEITLDDVRAITGTSNGQLFHYFPGGKEELVLEVVRLEAERVLEDQEPYLSNLTSWSSWERWRDAVVARYRSQGPQCPLATLMRQVGATPRADEAVAALLGRWESRLSTGIRAMQASGDFRDDLDPGRTAAAIVAAVQGGVQLLRTTGRTSHLEAVLDLLLDHLRTRSAVLPRPTGREDPGC